MIMYFSKPLADQQQRPPNARAKCLSPHACRIAPCRDTRIFFLIRASPRPVVFLSPKITSHAVLIKCSSLTDHFSQCFDSLAAFHIHEVLYEYVSPPHFISDDSVKCRVVRPLRGGRKQRSRQFASPGYRAGARTRSVSLHQAAGAKWFQVRPELRPLHPKRIPRPGRRCCARSLY